jgi:PEP-CTERM motif
MPTQSFRFQLRAISITALAALSGAMAQAGVNPDSITVTVGQTLSVGDPGGSGRTAELTMLSGRGVLSFSNGGILDTGLLASGAKPSAVGGLVGALNTGKVVLTSVDGAAITEKNVTLSSGRTQRGIVSIGANITSLTADGNTGAISLVTAQGGATQTAPFIDGTLEGGQMTVNNLKIDLQGKLVYADLAYKALDINGNYGPLVTNTNVALWNIGTITGPTVIPPEGLLAAADGDFSQLLALGYQQASATPWLASDPANWGDRYTVLAKNALSNLTVTDAGFSIFAAGLGLTEGSIGYDALAGVNTRAGGWGSMTSEILFEPCDLSWGNCGPLPVDPVITPEPATYALMGLGLVGVVAASRRRMALQSSR